MTSPLMSLHITPDAEGLATPRMRTLEWLLARMAVAVDPQAAGTGKCLVAGLADVSVLRLREARLRRRRDVVVVLPWVGAA
jgi:hypothetical protein